MLTASGGVPANLSGDFGVYSVFEQKIYRVGHDDDRGIGIFARASYSPPDRNIVDVYADAGIEFIGLSESRPKDKFGIAGGYARVSPWAQALDADFQRLNGMAWPVRSYEALFTVYGQPITMHTPLNSVGRYLMEANKPKTFTDAVAAIATTAVGPSAAEVAPSNLQTQPADGETIKNALPLIKANIASLGAIDPGSVEMRVSGLGKVDASFDPKSTTVAYQVTQRLKDKTCTVIVSAKSGGKKVETHWTFNIDDGGTIAKPPAGPIPSVAPTSAPTVAPPAAKPKKKKK